MTAHDAKMEESSVQKSVKGLEDLSKGVLVPELEALTFAGLQIVEAGKGFMRCRFIVPNLVADKIGNWQVGAMATLIDVMGVATICSVDDHIHVTVDLSISFYSTAKIKEEVEIEARFVRSRGKLTSVVVEVRRKENGELIAVGKQWSTSINKSTQDQDGNWHAGAVATLIDTVGATAVYSVAGYVHVSVDFTISFYSTAKIQEEVEIVAKVVGYRGELPCVEVEIRRKGNGELIALGRQWMYLRKNITQVQMLEALPPTPLPGHVKTSVDFNISFYSTAKIQEEVEIEAKVVGNKGKLTSVQIEDENGNWQVGAMATLIDDVGAAAIVTLGGNIKLSVDFNISFYSTAKIQEKIEIEAKVVGDRGKLTSVQVEVRRKDNGEVIALAKQWMASTNPTAIPRMSKSKL
ncbi:hypothetical protein Dsin_025220 [Dipteronia sinensis]|uniref:Acyl-coenzyme A thioesterase 13 n=1 Tax=Dipteronia sinensis TaxID=43782 RepID=A0AAD9ZV79_9ROSI|nr:hypothetical protein Dsin_025220 [Dipteronia sinensis]